MKGSAKKHTIVTRVDNNPGVVSRIAGLFTRRGYNIESLVTSATADPAIYQLTISVIAEDSEVELLIRQLGRVMEVIDMYDTLERSCIVREVMFLRIACPSESRTETISEAGTIASTLGLSIAGVGERSIIIEASGEPAKLDSALRAFSHVQIEEIIRSGAASVELM